MKDDWLEQLEENADLSLIPPLEWVKFKNLLKPLSLKTGDFLSIEGLEADKIAIIISGIFRAFYTTTSGNEHTIVFRGRGRIISPYNLEEKNRDAPFSLEALEESRILYLTVKEFETLLSGNICWEIVAGKYYMSIYREKEIREKELLSLDGESRYKNFLLEYPGYIDRIKHYHIASYLGISNVSLSRIRNKLNQKP